MTIKFGFDARNQLVTTNWLQVESVPSGLRELSSFLCNQAETIPGPDTKEVALPLWLFIQLKSQIREIIKSFNLATEIGVDFSSELRAVLARSITSEQSYISARNITPLSAEEVCSRLKEIGFERELSEVQKRNVGKLAQLSSGATFSVPGAGKTTEALATFFLRRTENQKLLVISPKNAFGSWEEQLGKCVPQYDGAFVRLRGGSTGVAEKLALWPDFMLITYQQLIWVQDQILEYCLKNNVAVYLDESHKIKSGASNPTAQAVLRLAPLSNNKLLLSGTPNPQSNIDLIPQLSFLFPEIHAVESNAVEVLQPLFVRTTKAEMDILPPDRFIKPVSMPKLQRELYRLLTDEFARDLRRLGRNRKRSLRKIGRSVQKILQFNSNPSLLATEISGENQDLYKAIIEQGDGPKLRYVFARARELVSQGHKVLIWTSFVKNVEYIADQLRDLGSVYIHGGVDTGDETDSDRREGKIKLFHDSDQVNVLVANPAAASEGISLHTVCHHAIYLDRSFNAAHYVQSEDRIHRFGLKPDQKTTIEFVECENSIDQVVNFRLVQKVERMAIALNDASLSAAGEYLDIDSEFELGPDILDEQDIQALLDSLALE